MELYGDPPSILYTVISYPSGMCKWEIKRTQAEHSPGVDITGKNGTGRLNKLSY
jgi:hypothetical protein